MQAWDADELPADATIDELLKRDLLGARRMILFVEGTERSLDKPLYSLIFPMVSVIPKGSCHDVERTVVEGRAVERFHWLRAFGIVDGDGYASDEVLRKRERGIYTVPFYSVEAIYFHPRVIEWIATRQASVTGELAPELTKRALGGGVPGRVAALAAAAAGGRVRRGHRKSALGPDQAAGSGVVRDA